MYVATEKKFFECYWKVLYADPKHIDKLKPERGSTRKTLSDLQLHFCSGLSLVTETLHCWLRRFCKISIVLTLALLYHTISDGIRLAGTGSQKPVFAISLIPRTDGWLKLGILSISPWTPFTYNLFCKTSHRPATNFLIVKNTTKIRFD